MSMHHLDFLMKSENIYHEEILTHELHNILTVAGTRVVRHDHVIDCDIAIVSFSARKFEDNLHGMHV